MIFDSTCVQFLFVNLDHSFNSNISRLLKAIFTQCVMIMKQQNKSEFARRVELMAPAVNDFNRVRTGHSIFQYWEVGLAKSWKSVNSSDKVFLKNIKQQPDGKIQQLVKILMGIMGPGNQRSEARKCLGNLFLKKGSNPRPKSIIPMFKGSISSGHSDFFIRSLRHFFLIF